MPLNINTLMSVVVSVEVKVIVKLLSEKNSAAFQNNDLVCQRHSFLMTLADMSFHTRELPIIEDEDQWRDVREGDDTSAIWYLFLTVNFGCHTRSLEDLKDGKKSAVTGKFSLFISVMSRLYDDSVAQNYSNIENMNTSLCTNYRKHLSLYDGT